MTATPGSLPPTFWQLIEATAERDPASVILADDHGRSLTRATLREEAERVAAALVDRGVVAETVVSWQLPSTLEAFVLMAALARVGATQNPLIPILRHREVAFITQQVGSELVIVPEVWRGYDHGAMARSVCAENKVPVLTLDLDALDSDKGIRLPHGHPEVLAPPPERDAVRWLYYSSGTTADPKGARHTDASIMASSAGMLAGVGFRADDVYPVAWPIAHIGGATMLTVSLISGVRLVLFDTFDPVTTPERMAAHRPTVLGTAVPFFRAFLDAQQRHGEEPLFPALRLGTFGGAPVPAELHDELRAAFGINIIGSWGLTEFPIATCATSSDSPEVLANSVGRVSPGVEIRVVQSDGAIAATGEEGELQLRGPQSCLGYVDPVLDYDAYAGDRWFRTGDLGTVDADGNVHITGRLKDIIIRNAENISVLEIEDLLFRHPAIVDAAVLGVPDARTGERVCAVVVVKPGETISLESLHAHCRAEGLAVQKCPEQLEIVDELPRNPMGKVLKQVLRAQVVGV